MRAVLFRLPVADSVLDALDGKFFNRYHLLVDVADGNPVSLWTTNGLVAWYEHEDRSWQDVVMDYYVPSQVSVAGRKESVPLMEVELPQGIFDRWLQHRQRNEDLAKDLVGFIQRV